MSRARYWILGAGIAVCVTCLSALRAADQTSKSKSKSKAGANNVKALDVKVEKLKTSLLKDIVEISAQYEDGGHYDRAKALLEDLAKLDPRLPGLKEKLEALENKIYDSQEVKVPFDAGSGWVPVHASVVKGRPVRVEVEGDYSFKYTAELTADGITAAQAGQDYFEGIPMGALIAVVVKDGKSGKAVMLRSKNQWTPSEDGQVMLKINAPTGHKSSGKLTVKLSGLVRTE